MNVVLRPHQHDGAEWLCEKPFALLLDEPRVGKTLTALEGAWRAGADRVAVIGPAIARGVWRSALRDLGESYGGGREKMSLFVDSYDRVSRNAGVRQTIKDLQPDVLILDEAHFLKSPESKRTKLIYGTPRNMGLKDFAGLTWGLTGTLIPNHLGETWTHLQAAGRAGRPYYPFLHRYCEGFETRYGWKPTGVREEHLDEFLGLLRPISLRRRMRDIWPDLPPVSWNVVPLEGAEQAYRTLQELERELKLDVLRDELQHATPEEAEARLEAVLLNTSQYQRIVSEAKRPLVLEEIRLLLDGGIHKIVVFAWFTDTVDYLHEHLRDEYGAVKIYGSTSERNREEAMARFQNDDSCRIIVGNIRSMGTAIPLYAARHALYADTSWSMGDMIQASKRIIHPEQTEPFEIIVCSLAGTTDDAVAQAHKRKAEQAGVLNALEA